MFNKLDKKRIIEAEKIKEDHSSHTEIENALEGLLTFLNRLVRTLACALRSRRFFKQIRFQPNAYIKPNIFNLICLIIVIAVFQTNLDFFKNIADFTTSQQMIYILPALLLFNAVINILSKKLTPVVDVNMHCKAYLHYNCGVANIATSLVSFLYTFIVGQYHIVNELVVLYIYLGLSMSFLGLTYFTIVKYYQKTIKSFFILFVSCLSTSIMPLIILLWFFICSLIYKVS